MAQIPVLLFYVLPRGHGLDGSLGLMWKSRAELNSQGRLVDIEGKHVMKKCKNSNLKSSRKHVEGWREPLFNDQLMTCM
jgi:hypothetical protein